MKHLILFITLLLPCVSFSELVPMKDEDLQRSVAQTGVTIEIQTNADIDIYYVDEGAGGGAIKVEGLKVVKTNASTGALEPNSSSTVVTELDVVDVSGNGGALSIQSSFANNTAIKIDAIRLGSVNNATGEVAFTNAYNNINDSVPANRAASLGQVNITGLSGSAAVSVRAH